MVSCVQFVPAAGFLASIEACCGCGVAGAAAAAVGVAEPAAGVAAPAAAFCCA